MKIHPAALAILAAVTGICAGVVPVQANSEKKPAISAETVETREAAKAEPADETAAKSPAKVKYTAGKDVDFEELLIQGRLQRPEVTVVTGDSGDGTDGLLRLRENFHDRMAVEIGEEVK